MTRRSSDEVRPDQLMNRAQDGLVIGDHGRRGRRSGLATLRLATRSLGLTRFLAEALAATGTVLAMAGVGKTVALTFLLLGAVLVMIRGVEALAAASAGA